MLFTTDSDLLAYEPRVFVDVPIPGQQRVRVTDAAITGTTLTSASADFEAAGVEPGAVVLVGDAALEVLARVDANTLSVSQPRAADLDAAIAPQAGEALVATVRTFAPQAAVVHATLLRELGIDTDDALNALTADAIVTESVMAALEALGTLAAVYALAVSVVGDSEAVRAKAAHYRQQFAMRKRGARVLIDTDGDGRADVVRQPGVTTLRRV